MNIFPTIVLGFAHGNDRILLHNAPQIHARALSSVEKDCFGDCPPPSQCQIWYLALLYGS